MANSCAVCGEPLHSGRCIDVLKRALRLARDQLDTSSNMVHVLRQQLESSSNAAPVPLESVSNEPPVLVSKSNVAFDKTAYQREYMRRRRAQHA